MDIKPNINHGPRRLWPKVVGTLLVCGLAAGITAGVYSIIMKDVKVIDEQKVYEVRTSAKTIGQALEEIGVQLNPGDVLDPDQDTELYDGLEINITRAISVKILADGRTFDILTTKRTVGDMLELAGLKLAVNDKIEPQVDKELSNGGVIKITRVTEGFVEQDEVLPYRSIKKDNPQMDSGFSRILSEGREGLKRITYKVVYEDGVEKSREIYKEQIVKSPQDRIVEYGTRTLVATSRGEVRFKRALNMVATAYCACEKCTGKNPGEKGYGITRSGMPVKPGVVAVDPRVIPLGSRLYVEGYGFAQAADTGSAIKGNRIDLYYSTHAESQKYGVKRIKVYVLD